MKTGQRYISIKCELRASEIFRVFQKIKLKACLKTDWKFTFEVFSKNN